MFGTSLICRFHDLKAKPMQLNYQKKQQGKTNIIEALWRV